MRTEPARPAPMQRLYDKVMLGRSKSLAVKMMCFECVMYDREEVRKCTDRGCPLFPYRPGVKSRNPRKGVLRNPSVADQPTKCIMVNPEMKEAQNAP
jgi:hypothetical protein